MFYDYVKVSKFYFLLLFLLGIIFMMISMFLNDYVVAVDNWVIDFVNTNIVDDGFTNFIIFLTNFGGVFVFVIFLVMFFFLLSNKRISCLMSINLLIAYVLSVIFKNIFRRDRPLFMLVEKPSDFSFPSGHSMCSIVFYGFLIYIVNKFIKNVYIRKVINIFLVLLMFLIPFSRLYLGVHFFTDVVAGVILGVVCLLSFLNYVKIKELL